MRRIDAANAEDPNHKELIYGERMTEVLAELYPEASEELMLAVRAQHIRRWTIARKQYPMDRDGYKSWRSDLARYHAETAGNILANAGYAEDFIERVKALVLKKKFKVDEEAQALEDVACIVFLKFYFAPFAAEHDDVKTLDVLRKTWVKMSSKGHEAALKLTLPEALRSLITRALSP